jgi:hypothetical protein
MLAMHPQTRDVLRFHSAQVYVRLKSGGAMSPGSIMLAAMQKQTQTPLRWRVADRLSGSNGRRAVWTAGGLAVFVVLLLMLLRPYVGRPLRVGQSGEVEQARIDCPAARTALTRSFNKADPSVPDEVRICVETGRAKAFTAGLAVFFILLGTWGASFVPMRRSRAHVSDGPSRWDRAIARAKTQAERPDG